MDTWESDLVSMVRKAVMFAQHTEDWELAKELSGAILVMKLEDIGVPPDMLAFAWMMSDRATNGRLNNGIDLVHVSSIPGQSYESFSARY